MTLADLPGLNALLNSTAAVFLVLGFIAIKRGKTAVHASLMIAAFVTSVLFLISYVIYHLNHPTTEYRGEGALRTLYLTILATHVVLAVLVPPLAIRTLYLAARARWASHRRWARWTFPIWMYVSVTGVVVYLMLYVFHAAA